MANRPAIIRTEYDRQRVVDMVASLDLSKPWKVDVKRHQKRRSLSQNNLYWMWIDDIAQDTGNEREIVHEEMKRRYCPAKEIRLGDVVGHVKSTTLLKTAEMTEYMERVRIFAQSELGILLPLPEEMHCR